MALKFKNKSHEEAFEEMLEAMYLSETEIKAPSYELKKQLAFGYLIALYQKDYAKYEGERFYFELGEELSLGGPTYLLDERYGSRNRDCEKIIPIACEILQDDELEEILQKEDKVLKSFDTPIDEEIGQLIKWVNLSCN